MELKVYLEKFSQKEYDTTKTFHFSNIIEQIKRINTNKDEKDQLTKFNDIIKENIQFYIHVINKIIDFKNQEGKINKNDLFKISSLAG